MSTALNVLYSMNSKDQVEHIELKNSASTHAESSSDRRQSNRVVPTSIEANRIVKQDILKLWKRVKNVPCEVNDISFSGIGISSKELIRINDIVDIELRSPDKDIYQLVSVRIRNHYRDDDGSYSYGGSLENILNKHFRRMIVQQLTG